MHDPKTTTLGGAGETLAAGAVIVPPPFNIAFLVAGTLLKVAAWYFAKDAHPPAKEPSFHVETPK